MGYLMQLKHSQSFHKLGCWKFHQLEVVGGKEKEEKKKSEKNAGSAREGGHAVPTSVNSPGQLQQKYSNQARIAFYEEKDMIFFSLINLSYFQWLE